MGDEDKQFDATPQKLERDMAAAPNMGFSSKPKRGMSAPAARGMPMQYVVIRLRRVSMMR